MTVSPLDVGERDDDRMLPAAPDLSAARYRGMVVEVSFTGKYAYIRQVNSLGQPYGPKAWFHRGNMRGAERERVRIPPAGARVTYSMVKCPDGRHNAKDVVVES